jgi:hypothetical protein
VSHSFVSFESPFSGRIFNLLKAQDSLLFVLGVEIAQTASVRRWQEPWIATLFSRRKEMSMLHTKMTLLLGVGVLALLPAAKASEWNQRTVFTFSGPVEIPGQVLPAGTYVFKLADSPSNRHIVQVFNKEENHVFGTFLAIPDYRLHPSDQTIVKFAERPAGSPEAIKGWFYPGRNYGHEFVYPKSEAVVLAQTNHTPVPFMPSELTQTTTLPDIALDAPEIVAMEAAPLKAERPTGEEAELSDVFVVSELIAPVELPEVLPSTATSMPVVGLIGLMSLGIAVVLRASASKAK